MPLLIRCTLAAFSGLLVYASYQPTGLWFAAPLGFALLFATLTTQRAILLCFIHALSLYLLLLPWVGEFVGAAAWIALATVQALYALLFGWGMKYLLRWKNQLLIYPASAALFISVEWLRSHWPFGGFGWGRIAWGQIGGPVAPYARYGGPALVTFLVIILGAAIHLLARSILTAARSRRPARTPRASRSRRPARTRHTPHPHHTTHTTPLSTKSAAITALFSITAIVCFGAFTQHQATAALTTNPETKPATTPTTTTETNAATNPETKQTADQPNHTVNVAAIQGNVPRLGLDFAAQQRAVLHNHSQQTHKLASDIEKGERTQPEIVVWPENSADVNPLTDDQAAAEVADAVNHINAPILVGTVSPTHNTMLVWQPRSTNPPGPGDTHHKKFLQPFGEYMPFRNILRKINSYVDQAGNLQPGHGNGIVRMTTTSGKHLPVGVSTCYEISFDASPREAVAHGAHIIASPTNNATFGFTDMTYQQLAMSRMRAIEYDRSVIVAATSGVSALIRPDGEVVAQSRIFTPDILQSELPLRDTHTPALRAETWVEGTLATLGVAAAVASFAATRVYRQTSKQRRRK